MNDLGYIAKWLAIARVRSLLELSSLSGSITALRCPGRDMPGNRRSVLDLFS